MAHLSMTWGEVEGLRILQKAMADLSPKTVRRAGAAALNHTGPKARTATRKALARQTGLPSRHIGKRIRTDRATAGQLAFRLSSKGGDIPLKYFKARETLQGVSAAPFNRRGIYPGTFMKGGRFPNRKGVGFDGNVMYRVGKGRYPVKAMKSGVVLPREMVKDESAKAWNAVVSTDLPPRILHDLKRLTGKAFT